MLSLNPFCRARFQEGTRQKRQLVLVLMRANLTCAPTVPMQATAFQALGAAGRGQPVQGKTSGSGKGMHTSREKMRACR